MKEKQGTLVLQQELLINNYIETHMDNALEMLKMDHQKVRELFDAYDSASHDDFDTKHAIAQEVFQELEMHMDLEEEIFYPAVENKGQDAMVAESVAEHDVVKDLINDLVDISVDDEEFSAKFSVMKENIFHHVHSEETKMFPFAEKNLEDQLEQLGKEMFSLKRAIQKEMAR